MSASGWYWLTTFAFISVVYIFGFQLNDGGVFGLHWWQWTQCIWRHGSKCLNVQAKPNVSSRNVLFGRLHNQLRYHNVDRLKFCILKSTRFLTDCVDLCVYFISTSYLSSNHTPISHDVETLACSKMVKAAVLQDWRHELNSWLRRARETPKSPNGCPRLHYSFEY